VMSNGAPSGTNGYSGALYQVSGPAFNASPWTTATPHQVGTMTVSFTDGDDGTLQYTYNGVSVTKSITRQVFGALRTDCGPQDQ